MSEASKGTSSATSGFDFMKDLDDMSSEVKKVIYNDKG